MPSHPTHCTRASEDGFTLVELLVAMVAALTLAGALMAFLITTVDQQNDVSSQTYTTRQGEIGMSQFVRDVRDAQSNPVAVSATWPLGNRTPIVITYTGGATAGFTANFYTAPAGGCDGTTGAGGSPCFAVSWSCTAGGTCARTCTSPTAALASGPCKVSSPPAVLEVSGVTSAAITPLDSNSNTIGTAVSGVPPGSSFPSYVSLILTLKTISQSDSGQTYTLRGSSPVVLEQGVNLRNWS
jgi:prepilin-type N-terminal cleavage/methylation domain-containing protein